MDVKTRRNSSLRRTIRLGIEFPLSYQDQLFKSFSLVCQIAVRYLTRILSSIRDS